MRLRKAESDLVTERDDLKQKIQALEATIQSADLSLPPGFDDPESGIGQSTSVSPYDMPATASYATDEFNHQRLHVAWPTFSTNDTFSQPQHPTSLSPPHGVSPHQQDPQQQQQQQNLRTVGQPRYSPRPTFAEGPEDLSFKQLTVSRAESKASEKRYAYAPPTDKQPASGLANSLEVAIDFVLSLEHPCMDHIPSSQDPGGQDPANHMMMVSIYRHMFVSSDMAATLAFHHHFLHVRLGMTMV